MTILKQSPKKHKNIWMRVLLVCSGPGHYTGPNSNISILRSQVTRITFESRILSKVSVQRRCRQRFQRCLCFSAVDAQTGPVVRYHQEVLVHGFTEPSSVKLWRDNGGHLSWRYQTAQKQEILIRHQFRHVCNRRSLYLLWTGDFNNAPACYSRVYRDSKDGFQQAAPIS